MLPILTIILIVLYSFGKIDYTDRIMEGVYV
jgi:hypothetical protein